MSESLQRDVIPQAGAIPYRRGGDQVEFCVITSSGGSRWGFPKGIVEAGDTPTQTALQEAFEEAGLHGRIVAPALGSYRYRKWNAELEVTMYLMETDSADGEWPESELRERDWLPADEALQRLDRPALRQLLMTAMQRLT